MIWPVVTYAPTAAIKPNIAAQPLKRSASGVMIKKELYLWNIVTAFMKLCKVYFDFFVVFHFYIHQYVQKWQYCYINVSVTNNSRYIYSFIFRYLNNSPCPILNNMINNF